VLQGNILDPSLFARLKDDFDYIVHAAGVLGIKKVVEEPLLTADVNVFGTRNVLEFARTQKKLKRFLLFSTSEIYGQSAGLVSENDPAIIPNQGMRWVYASSKHFSEYLLKAFIKEYGLPGVIIRPFNVYGPFRKGGNAMTAIVQKALNGEDIYLSGDGTQMRAWCYIDDFIQGLYAALHKENIIGEAFNLGNPEQYLSIHQMSRLICKLLNSSSKIHITGSQEDDVLDRRPSIQNARECLGYDPKVDLQSGILEVANYLCSHLQKV
jgi:UDP-glucose 4-epimerase